MSIRFFSIAILFFAGFSIRLYSATITSARSGIFFSTSTWVGGVIPTATDDVVISGTHQITMGITSDYTINSISYTGAGKFTLTTSADKTLYVTNGVNLDGTDSDMVLNGNLQTTTIDLVQKSTLSIGAGFTTIATGAMVFGITQNQVFVDGTLILGSLVVSGNKADFFINAGGSVQVLGDVIVQSKGELSVQNSGTLAVSGNVTVTDNGSTFNVSGTANINGTLTVENGATTTVNTGGTLVAGDIVGSVGGGGTVIDLSTLPIVLVKFDVIENSGDALVTWTTSSEEDNDYFTIEKSYDAINYTSVSNIAGAGFSSQTLHYSFTDENPGTGTIYYRLKQTDYNGEYSYSKVKSLSVNKFSSINNVDIIHDSRTLSVEFSQNFTSATLLLYDTNGRILKKAVIDGSFERYSTSIEQINDCVILVEVKVNNTRLVRKIYKK